MRRERNRQKASDGHTDDGHDHSLSHRKPDEVSALGAEGGADAQLASTPSHDMYVGLNPWDGIGEQVVDLPASLSSVSGSGEAYHTAIAGRDLVFVPYFTVDTERYNTYFRIA